MDSKTDFELNLNLEIISFDFYSSCQRSSWMHVFSSSYKNYARFRKTKITKTVPKIKFFCYLWADSKQLKYPYFTLKVSVLNSQPMKTRFWTVWVLFIPVDFSQRTTLFNPQFFVFGNGREFGLEWSLILWMTTFEFDKQLTTSWLNKNSKLLFDFVFLLFSSYN